MENSMKFAQKIKNRTTILSSIPTSECISKGHENRISKKRSHLCVYLRIIHSSQDVETTQVPINR